MQSNEKTVSKNPRRKKPDKFAAKMRLTKDEVSEDLIVYHAVFGKGVIRLCGMLRLINTELVIAFRDTVRKIILEYASLTTYNSE